MKSSIILLLLAAVASQCCAVTLKEEFDELLALFPIPEIQKVFDKHMGSNPDLQKIVAYLQSDEWKKNEEAIRSEPLMQELQSYITNTGIDCDSLLNIFHGIIANAKPTGTGNKTLQDFINEVLEILPMEKIASTLINKLLQSKPVKDFYNEISSPKYQKLFEKILEMPACKKIRKIIEDMNIKWKPLIEGVYIIFGWKLPSTITI